jgi:hypothetical protein
MLAAAVLALSACGSESRVRSRPAPRLPRAVATKLAARSDALAAALRRGDGCAAKIQMHGLERQTRLALSSGRIPTAFRARLLAAVDDLSGRMPTCVPPPPPPPPPAIVRQPPPKHGKEKKKEHGKHDKGKKGHGKGGEG